MKVKIYNAANCLMGAAGNPCMLRLTRVFGYVFFSKDTQKKLGIDESSRIEFAQDVENPRDWYLRMSDSPDAFPITLSHNSQIVFFKSMDLVDFIYGSLGLKGNKPVEFCVGQQTEDGLWPLILSAVR